MAINTQAAAISKYLDPVGTRLPGEVSRIPWFISGTTTNLGTSFQIVNPLATDIWDFRDPVFGADIPIYIGCTHGLSDSDNGLGTREIFIPLVSGLGVDQGGVFATPPAAGSDVWKEYTFTSSHSLNGVPTAATSSNNQRSNVGDIYVYRTSSPAAPPPQSDIMAIIPSRTGVAWGSPGKVVAGYSLYLTRLLGYASAESTIEVDITTHGIGGLNSGSQFYPYYDFLVNGNFDIPLHSNWEARAQLRVQAKSTAGASGLRVTLEGYLVEEV